MPELVEHLWTILCQQVVDDGAGRVTIGPLIDFVMVPDLPVWPVMLPVGFTVISQWRRNGEPGCSLEERLLIEHSDGGRAPVAGPTIVNLGSRHLCSTIMLIGEIPLRGYGQYWFVVQRRDAPNAQWRDAAPTAGLWVPPPSLWPSPAGP